MDEAAMLATVRERLARARRVLVVTGAGISAESGIPTFRGADGYWRNHRAEELASPEGFARDPQLVWEWYDHRRRLVAECEPNAGHQAVAALERRAPEFMLITQNVDGLHRLAGSERVVELHGNIWRVKRADGGGAPFEDRELRDKDQLPPRDEAGRLLRPARVKVAHNPDGVAPPTDDEAADPPADGDAGADEAGAREDAGDTGGDAADDPVADEIKQDFDEPSRDLE